MSEYMQQMQPQRIPLFGVLYKMNKYNYSNVGPQTVPQTISQFLDTAPFQMVNYELLRLEDCFLNKNYCVFLYKHIYVHYFKLSQQLQQSLILVKILTQAWGRGEG